MTKEKVDQIEETTELEEVTIPEYSLIDVMREQKTLQNRINELEQNLETAVAAVKALGSEVIKNNEEVIAKLDIFNEDMHTIKDAIVYGLARFAKQPLAPAPKQPIQHANDLGDLEKLKWTTKNWGDWAFTHTQDGKVTEGAEQLFEALKHDRKVVSGGYEYSLSKDGKFFNRHKQK